MKKHILVILVLALSACMQPLEKTSSKQNYVLKGTLNGEFDEYVKIKYNDRMDSVKVENNSFQFEGEVSSPTAFQFQFDSTQTSKVFYLENDTLRFDIIVDEVKNEVDYYKEFNTRYLSGGKTEDLKTEMKSFLNETPKSKLNRDLIINQMDSLIKAYPNHDYLGKLLSELSMNQDLLYNDVRALITKLDVDELNSQDVAILEKYQQKRRNFQVGSEIPDYELISINSDTATLTSEFEKYNLIYFWNSWCELCSSQQKELLEIYQAYNFKGFEIIGVSLDSNQDDWISAVTEESFPWKSLRVENGFTGDMASEMGIIDLPQSYLVDQKGRIIEINLSLSELKTILSALIN